jgi:hypothetical protein
MLCCVVHFSVTSVKDEEHFWSHYLRYPRKLPHVLGLTEVHVTAVCECGGQTGGQPLIPPVRVEHPH